MMYFRALTEGIADLPAADAKIRAAIDAEAEASGWPALHLQLAAVDANAAARIKAYLDEAGHGHDKNGPLFRPVRANPYADREDRHLVPKQIDRIFKRWARKIGLKEGFSSHSMRTTFITTALNNGASMEDVQDAVGHAHSSTTQLYDRRGYNAERSASLFASY